MNIFLFQMKNKNENVNKVPILHLQNTQSLYYELQNLCK